jgi:hypothetical protein
MKKGAPVVTLIALFLMAFFVVFIAVKQYYILKQQIYNEAYYDSGELNK